VADANVQQQVFEILSDPMNLPSTFWDYMVKRWQRDAPVFPITQVFGYTSQPGYELGYTEFTANVSVRATTETTANTIVTAPAVSTDGATRIRVEFFSPFVRNPAAGRDDPTMSL